MSITGELRKWNDETTILPITRRQLLDAISDRIDAEHEKAIRELNNLADSITDSCMQLPKDANGEYIHIGDVMHDINESPSEKFNVAIMELNKWGWSLIDSYGERNEPSQCCHHHQQTVEDVLDEFASAYDRIGGEDEEHQKYLDLIAEYAAKLQLKERK